MSLVQDESFELECQTELVALHEELQAADPIERVAGIFSLPADANNSVLNTTTPAPSSVFTF